MIFSDGLYWLFPAYENLILLMPGVKLESMDILPVSSVIFSSDLLSEYRTLIFASFITSSFAVLRVAI